METVVPSLDVLKKLLVLVKKRDALVGELARAEERLAAARSGPAPAQASAPRKTRSASPRRPASQGALEETIPTLLRAAGDKGLPVRELSRLTGAKTSHIHLWFDTIGRNLGLIQKIGPGSYRLKPGV